MLQTSTITSGKIYKATFEVLDYQSGSVRINLGGAGLTGLGNLVSANGVYTQYITSDGVDVYMQGRSSFNGSITNISVKEVGMDWFLSGVDFSLGAVYFEASGDSARQTFSDIVGTLYKITIVKSGSGILRFRTGFAGDDGTIRQIASDGVAYFTATSNTNRIQFYGDASNTPLTLNSVSVVAVTTDTNLPRINYEGFSYQDVLGSELITNGGFDNGTNNWTPNANATLTIDNNKLKVTISGASGYPGQFVTTEIGKTYKVTADAFIGTSSRLALYNDADGQFRNLYADGSFDFNITATSTSTQLRLYVFDDGSYGLWDNVSVKEYLGQEVVPNSGCGSWLWEPQSTNLIPYSEDFSGWASNYTSLTSGFNSPDGASGATLLSGDGVNVYPNISRSAASAGDVSYSVFVKKELSDEIALRLQGTDVGGVGNVNAVYTYTFSTNSFAIVSAGVAESFSAQPLVDGWIRLQLNFTSTTITACRIYPAYGTASTDGVYIWGAQLEALPYATSYIPTSGSTVTRNQDVCTNGGSLATINSTEGTLYFEGATLADNTGTFRSIALSDGTVNNRIIISYTDAANTIRVLVFRNNALQVIMDRTINATDTSKVAISYKFNEVEIWINGVKEGTDTNAFMPIGLNQLSFSRGDGDLPFFGKTKALAVWKEALSDQELADLTYPTPTDPTFSLDFDTIAEQFTFARGSEATYVDAQGLIQSTNELGSELVLNGNFDTDSDWNKNSNWSISGGEANCDGTSNGDINQGTTLATIGKSYKISYEVVSISQGEFFFKFGGVNGTMRNSIGVYTETIQAINTNRIALDSSNNAIGSIDNVSVKEVISATNTPRLDYSTGAEAFLLEPQSTNLIPYSEDFSSLNIRSNAVVTSNQIISPSGLLDADEITFDGTFSGRVEASISAIVGQPYTISLYLKNKDLSDVTQVWIGFSVLSQGQFVTITDEWQRYDITTNADGATEYPRIQFSGTGSLYAWGFQTEQQSYATSYIPTSGTTVTRNQETCINATPEINSEEGVLYFEGAILSNDGTYKIVSLSDGTTLNVVRFYYSITDNRIVGNVKSGGGIVFDFNHALQDSTDFLKIAISYRLNDFKMYVNGIKVAADTAGSAPIGLNILTFNNGGGNSPFFGNTKDLQVYTKALSDAELIKLTT